jgi:two-component system, OmpR family, sensor histidine kinase KdpD
MSRAAPAATAGPRRSVRGRRILDRLTPVLRRWTSVGLAAALALGGATALVAVLEYGLDVPDASSVYLLAVVVIAVFFGVAPAVFTAVAGFILHDFLFIEPRYTLVVNDPRELVTLLLLLVVGLVVSRLAGESRDRAIAAEAREREARTMFNVSFTLASERETTIALPPIATLLRDEIRASRVWIVVGDTVAADTAAPARAPTNPVVHTVLRRRPGDDPAEWVRVHAPTRAPKSVQDPAEQAYQVVVTASGRAYGAVWVARPRDLGPPDMGETRVLAAAADQIGGSLERDRLQRDATTAEISRRSDALKSALLDSVSHDLRTPLASIRAAAGTLMDPEVEWPPDQRREIAASIDLEAEWLNRLVTNLLDMSRVEAGELRPSLAVFSLADLVGEAVRRSASSLADRAVDVSVATDLPPVVVDEVFIGQVLANTLDNAAKYSPPDAPIHVSARAADGRVTIVVEDGGPGVPPEDLPRLFEKFYRVQRKGEGSRRGTGIGLAVVRGLVEAMGGHVDARRSELGGLAIELDLPIAAARPDTLESPSAAAQP